MTITEMKAPGLRGMGVGLACVQPVSLVKRDMLSAGDLAPLFTTRGGSVCRPCPRTADLELSPWT